MGLFKDRTLFILIGILLIIILIAGGLYFYSGKDVNPITPGEQLQKDIASMPNADAVRIALNDSEVQRYLANHTYNSNVTMNNVYAIENASGFANMYDLTGYVNGPPDEYQHVAIQIMGTMSYFDAVDLLLTVDMTEKKVVGLVPRHRIAWMPQIYAVIPPGAYWYHQFSSYPGPVDIQPNNSTAYTAIFTEDNFYRFMNGTSYTASVFNNNTSQWVNTTAPFTENLSYGSLPLNATFWQIMSNYYLVIKNGENDTEITIRGIV